MKKRGFLLAGMLLIGLLFLVLINIPYHRFSGNQVVIGKDTTVLDGPVRKDGGVDYLAAVNERMSEGVTLENNAVALLFRLTPFSEFGSDDSQRHAFEKSLSEKLGFPQLPERMELTDPFFTLRKELFEEIKDGSNRERIDRQILIEQKRYHQPWSSEQFPKWSQHLERIQDRLDLAVEASSRTAYYQPLIIPSGNASESRLMVDAFLPVVSCARLCAHSLRFRAMNSLANGSPKDIESAISDVMAIRRLACLQSRSMVVIEKYFAITVFSNAVAAEQSLLTSDKMTEKQLKDYQSFLKTHSCQIEIGSKIDQVARFMALDQVQNLQIRGIQATQDFSPPGMTDPQSNVIGYLSTTANLAESMRVVNGWYDQYVGAFEKPSMKETRDAVVAIESKMRQMAMETSDLKYSGLRMMRGANSRGRWIGDIQSARWLPNVSRAFDAEFRGLVRDQMTAIAFALARFKKDHGQFPESLQPLVPEYMDDLYIDPLNEKPYTYVLTDDGFLLYSFGADGVDNQGQNYFETEVGADYDSRVCFGTQPVYEHVRQQKSNPKQPKLTEQPANNNKETQADFGKKERGGVTSGGE